MTWILRLKKKSHEKIYDKEEGREIYELDFGDTPEKLTGDYLDMYKCYPTNLCVDFHAAYGPISDK